MKVKDIKRQLKNLDDEADLLVQVDYPVVNNVITPSLTADFVGLNNNQDTVILVAQVYTPEYRKPTKDDIVVKWYHEQFKYDDEWDVLTGGDMTFTVLWLKMQNGEDYYDLMDGDTIQRERIFTGISEAFCIDYDVVYNTWVDNEEC